MASALIGNAGFVGANLASQAHFDEKYDSRNIEGIRGKGFDLIVCAGLPAEKWKANRDEAEDLAALQRLIDPLREARAEKFALISTVDVYARPEMVDEDAPPDAQHPYGRHRHMLEEFCRKQFNAAVLRLPLLFGPGLKKNVLFDLLLDRQVEDLHPDGVHQYYGIAHLWRDVNITLEKGVPVLNVACEPIATRELALRCFGRELTAYPSASPPIYDVRSKYAPLWGGNPFGYLYSKERVLHEITDFIEREQAL